MRWFLVCVCVLGMCALFTIYSIWQLNVWPLFLGLHMFLCSLTLRLNVICSLCLKRHFECYWHLQHTTIGENVRYYEIITALGTCVATNVKRFCCSKFRSFSANIQLWMDVLDIIMRIALVGDISHIVQQKAWSVGNYVYREEKHSATAWWELSIYSCHIMSVNPGFSTTMYISRIL